MAVATIRRLLIELGYTLAPEDPRGQVGPLTLWITESRSDLAGLTPLQALSLPDGETRLRQVLIRMLRERPSAPALGASHPTDSGQPVEPPGTTGLFS